MNPLLDKNLAQIKRLMLMYGVYKAYTFGSVAKDSMHKGSDIDFMVSFDPTMNYEA